MCLRAGCFRGGGRVRFRTAGVTPIAAVRTGPPVASDNMRTRELGRGGPEESVVGLGADSCGPRMYFEQAKSVVAAAIEHGITLFDTADISGRGSSEDFIGRALEA